MTEKDFSNAAFQAFLSEHKLAGARCQSCGALFLPPRPMCTNCYSEDMEWAEVPGEGELVAFTTIHIAPTAMLEAGYGRDNPYCSGVVKLENGLSISAQILGVDASKPETIKVRTPVSVDFIERGEGDAKETFLVFRAK